MKMFVLPLHIHTDVSVTNIVSGVDASPDDFKIPPADCLLLAQGHTQSVLELDVGFVHLDNQAHSVTLDSTNTLRVWMDEAYKYTLASEG